MISVLKSTLVIMTPILFAAAGGLLPALAGTLNIALEGMLLIGAFASLTVFYFTGNIFAAVISAAISASTLAAIHAFCAFKLRANVFITGLAVNLLANGLCIVLSDNIFQTKGVVTTPANTGSNLINIYLVLIVVLLLLLYIAINKTPFGYRLRACEKNSEALISLGIRPMYYRVCAFLISGFFCGIGGSFLALNLGSYVPGMSAGKGWIALVVIFLGARKPQGILAAAFIFALAESLSNHAQGFLRIPAGFILAFPYVITLVGMILVSKRGYE